MCGGKGSKLHRSDERRWEARPLLRARTGDAPRGLIGAPSVPGKYRGFLTRVDCEWMLLAPDT